MQARRDVDAAMRSCNGQQILQCDETRSSGASGNTAGRGVRTQAESRAQAVHAGGRRNGERTNLQRRRNVPSLKTGAAV